MRKNYTFQILETTESKKEKVQKNHLLSVYEAFTIKG
jgi:hypothetical protein